jgi:predicted small secreted protein
MSSTERNKKMKRTMLGMTLVFVLGALVLAGCGGSSGGGGTETSTTASSGSGSEASTAEGKAGGMVDISEEAKACLKEKGVQLPEFKGGEGEGGPPSGGIPEGGEKPEGGEPPSGTENGEKPEGTPPPARGFGGEGNEEMQKAFEECGVETPEFKGGPGSEGGAPKLNSAAFKKRVKRYVACVKENGYELAEPNFSGEGPVFEKAESESAAFKKASASCQNLLGGPTGGSGSATSEEG